MFLILLIFFLIRLLATCSADHTVKLWDTTQALLDSVALSDPHSSSHRSHGIPPHLQYNNNNTTFSASSSSTSTGGSGFAAAATTTSASTTKTPQFVLDKTISGHQRWVWDCSFSADSAYLVTGKSIK